MYGVRLCACNLAYVTCFNSISRQRGDPDESLLSLEPGLFSLTDNIVQQHHVYLRKMRANHNEGRLVVFLDETRCNVHDGKLMNWVELYPVCKVEQLMDLQGLLDTTIFFTNVITIVLQQAIWERRTSNHTTCRWQRRIDRW